MIKIATLALFGALTIGFAQPQVNQLPRRALRSLNLTEAQKQQLKTIGQQSRQTAQPLREQLLKNREAMRTAVRNNDTAEIQRLAGLQGNLETQIVANRAQGLAKFYATLTPEQAAQLDKREKRGMGLRGRAGR